MAHVIAVTNQKGGVGKTTTAINLGAALAEQGRYTLIADLDPQGGLSLGLGLAAHDLDLTIYNVMTDTRIPVAGVVHHIRAHLDLLPSNIDLAVAEFQLIAQMGREYILREALQNVRDTYEYIILDCPPSLNLLTVNALTASDSLIVPLQVEYFAMRGLEQLMDVVARVRRRLNPSLEILGIVPTMVDVRRLNDQQILQEVGKAYPGMLLDVYVKESIKFADAPRHQRSILEMDPRHDGARSYRKLAREVLRHYGEWADPEPYTEAPVEQETAAFSAELTETIGEGQQAAPLTETPQAAAAPPAPIETLPADAPVITEQPAMSTLAEQAAAARALADTLEAKANAQLTATAQEAADALAAPAQIEESVMVERAARIEAPAPIDEIAADELRAPVEQKAASESAIVERAAFEAPAQETSAAQAPVATEAQAESASAAVETAVLEAPAQETSAAQAAATEATVVEKPPMDSAATMEKEADEHAAGNGFENVPPPPPGYSSAGMGDAPRERITDTPL